MNPEERPDPSADIAERELPLLWVEVFAEAPLQGNLLPVLLDADGVPDRVLAALARRFLYPETSFLQGPTDSTADYRHRIYTVAGEIPFAGHPSLGAAAAHSHRQRRPEAELVQQTPSGLQPLRVRLHGKVGWVSLGQDPARFEDPVESAAILEALGVAAAEAEPTLPACVGSTGLPALLLPVRSVDSIRRARLDRDRLRAALRSVVGLVDPETINCYLVAEQAAGHWRARSFALDLSQGEDPATGSAAGPLGAYLRHHRGVDRIVVDQGVELGSPSRLHVDTRDGIELSGRVRIVGTGTFRIPLAITDLPGR